MTDPGHQSPHSAHPSNSPLIAATVALLVASTASLLYWHSTRRAHALTSEGPLSSRENSDNTLKANSDKDKMAIAVHSTDDNLVPGAESKVAKTRSKDRRRRGKDPLKEIMKNTKRAKNLLQNIKTTPAAEPAPPTSQEEVQRASSSRSRRSSITESTRSSSSSAPTWEEEKTSESSVSRPTAPPTEIEALGDADTTLTPHALSNPTIPTPLDSSTNELKQSQQIITENTLYETSSSTPSSTTTTTTNAGSTTSAVTSDFPQSSESQSVSDSTPLDRMPSPTRQDTVRPAAISLGAGSSSNGSDPWAWDGLSEPRQKRVGSKSRTSRASSSTRSPAASPAMVLSTVMGYSRPAAPPRPSSSLAKDSPASVPSVNVMDAGLGTSSVVYNTVGPRLSITPSPTPLPGSSNLSAQTQLASLRGALEAARVREEKNRQEAERLVCECEALKARWWEDVSAFRRKEMEYQNHIQYLMHSLHAYASFAASQPASPSGHLPIHNPISTAFTSPGTNSPSSSASQAQLPTIGTQPPPSILPQSQPQSPALSGAAAATFYYPQAVYQTGPPLPPAPGSSQAPMSTNGGIHMPLSMLAVPQMAAGPWGMPMPISSPTVLLPNGAIPAHVSEQQRGRTESRNNGAHSHESMTIGGGNGNGVDGFDGFPSMPGIVSASASLPPHPMESSWIHVPHPHAHAQGMMVPSQSMPLPQLHNSYNNDYQEDPVDSNDVNDALADAILKRPQSLRAASSSGDLGGLREEEEGREEKEIGADNEGVVREGEKKKGGKKKKQRPYVFTFPSLSNIGNVVQEQEWSSEEEEDEDDSEGPDDEALVSDGPSFPDAGDVIYDTSGSAGQLRSASPNKEGSAVVNESQILTSDVPTLMRRTSDAENLHGRSVTEPVR